MPTVFAPMESHDSRDVLRGFNASAEGIFRRVGIEEIDFFARFGARVYSTTQHWITEGLKLFVVDNEIERVKIGDEVQCTALQNRECNMWGIVSEKFGNTISIIFSVNDLSAIIGGPFNEWEIQVTGRPRDAIETSFSNTSIDPTVDGPLTWVVPANKFYPVGGSVLATALSDPDVILFGRVAAYSDDGTNLVLQKVTTTAEDPGAYSSWRLSLIDGPPIGLSMGEINGLSVAPGSVDPLHDILVYPGTIRDSTGLVDLSLPLGLTKQLDADWVIGSNQGALIKVPLPGTVSGSGNNATGVGTNFLTAFGATGAAGLSDWEAWATSPDYPATPTRSAFTKSGSPLVAHAVNTVTSDTVLTYAGSLSFSNNTIVRGGTGSANSSNINYGVILIRRDVDGVIDVCLSALTGSGEPDRPAGWTLYRVIAMVSYSDTKIVRIKPLLTPEASDNDISAGEVSYDGGNSGLSANNVQGAIDELAAEGIPEDRTFTAGDGLTGGGSLAANRTFHVGAGSGIAVTADAVGLDFGHVRNVAHDSVSMIAGNGLTGGGNIASDKTFNVGAGEGITVAADAVGLNTSHVRNVAHDEVSMIAGNGLTGGGSIASDRTFNVGAGDGITVGGDAVALDPTHIRNVAHNDVSMIAGNGLTGGGSIAADRTFHVGAGEGITVGGDAVSLDTSHVRNISHDNISMIAGNGLTGGGTIAADRTFHVGAGAYISVAADTVAVDAAALMAGVGLVYSDLGFGAPNRIILSADAGRKVINSDVLIDATGMSNARTLRWQQSLAHTELTPVVNDLNELKVPGFYWAAAPANSPIPGQYIYIFVQRYYGWTAWLTQTVYGLTDVGVYQRRGIDAGEGAQGWMEWISLSAVSKHVGGQDLNNIDAPGNYDGQSMINAPAAGHWYITVQRYAGETDKLQGTSIYVSQMLYPLASAGEHIWRRYKVGGWSPWYRIANAQNIIAGAGLQGGGSSAGDVTLDVYTPADSGLTASADALRLDINNMVDGTDINIEDDRIAYWDASLPGEGWERMRKISPVNFPTGNQLLPESLLFEIRYLNRTLAGLVMAEAEQMTTGRREGNGFADGFNSSLYIDNATGSSQTTPINAGGTFNAQRINTDSDQDGPLDWVVQVTPLSGPPPIPGSANVIGSAWVNSDGSGANNGSRAFDGVATLLTTTPYARKQNLRNGDKLYIGQDYSANARSINKVLITPHSTGFSSGGTGVSLQFTMLGNQVNSFDGATPIMENTVRLNGKINKPQTLIASGPGAFVQWRYVWLKITCEYPVAGGFDMKLVEVQFFENASFANMTLTSRWSGASDGIVIPAPVGSVRMHIDLQMIDDTVIPGRDFTAEFSCNNGASYTSFDSEDLVDIYLVRSNAHFGGISASAATSTFQLSAGDPWNEGFRENMLITFTGLPVNSGKAFRLIGFSGPDRQTITVDPAPIDMGVVGAYTIESINHGITDITGAGPIRIFRTRWTPPDPGKGGNVLKYRIKTLTNKALRVRRILMEWLYHTVVY